MATKSLKKHYTNHAVMLHIDEIASRVVAQSGIPSDRFHLGKLIMQGLKDDPDFVLQIDGSVNVSETNASVLSRSIRCACALKSSGLKFGDVISIMAPHHNDLAIAFYAALYLGVVMSGTDITLKINELKGTFERDKPKIVFCQYDKASDVEEALKLSNVDAQIVTFDKGSKFTFFADFLHEGGIERELEDFKPADFDSETAIAILTATSGSTGLPKCIILTHKNIIIGFPQFFSRFYDFPTPTRLDLLVSPIQWISASTKYVLSPILRFTRLQSSAPNTKEHIYELINTYKPTSSLIGASFLALLFSPGDRDRCDFSSFEYIITGGSQIPQALVDTVKLVAPHVVLESGYGMSETAGKSMSWDSGMPPGSVGRPMGYLKHRLVNVTTLEDIDDPFVTGELWVKGPSVSPGFYQNPEANKELFAEEGWLRTGDLLYRDEQHHYFFVDRLKTLIKYRTHHVSPAEVEEVIRRHPGVFDAAVVGVPDYECGELPAAAVVLHQGATVTAQEIKDLVAESLSEAKQLRGGVMMMKELPTTVTQKLDRSKLKEMLKEMNRE